MPRFSKLLLISLLAVSPIALAGGKAPAKKAPAAKAAKAPKAPVKKAVPPPSAEHKKKLAELLGGYKFGMTKDEVIADFGKKLDEKYADKLKGTTDVAAQDRIRADKKREIGAFKNTFVSFEANKPSPWDVSIVEEELAHDTGESMLEKWENEGGKNQRRFFFFYQGKLWKMFVSLDVSILPEDKKNFDTFQGVMQAQYGPGNVEPGRITWRAGEFEVRAVDKLKSYDALGLAIEDAAVKKDVLALREVKAPKKAETSAVIKAVLDTDKTDKPDVKANSNAVDEVIKAQGGTPKKR
ncbi:MAG: hypothetical protein H0T46_09855 [Deltaproteobacteria bacterium]|nr:hypothetical protein [Deltaproteobacteria bacterium]